MAPLREKERSTEGMEQTKEEKKKEKKEKKVKRREARARKSSAISPSLPQALRDTALGD